MNAKTWRSEGEVLSLCKEVAGREMMQRAVAWHRQGRLEDAAKLYLQILERQPDDFDALRLLGILRHQKGDKVAALNLIGAALKINSRTPDAWSNYAVVLLSLSRVEEALSSCERALAIDPNHAQALNQRGNILARLGRAPEALISYEKALVAKPDHRYALDGLAASALAVCDWTRAERLLPKIKAQVTEGRSIIEPFTLLGYTDDPLLLRQSSATFIRHNIPAPPAPLWNGEIWHSDKIRVAYLSADFGEHATSVLIAELFELHDRDRFEILGVSFGPDDRSAMRARVISAFDRFHDVRSKSNREIALLLRSLEVNIAVDLNGYTRGGRPGILAFRPAPIQVNYLGFPSTMAANFIDYIIADEVIAPYDKQQYCTEKIVYLPDCFQVNGSKQDIGAQTPTRQQVGLPEQAFVFCCFNNSYKITSPIFDVWMRLLRSIEHSVLWLFRANEWAEKNLRQEAAKRGVDPERLIFADKVRREEHLARHRLADVFLDTLPVNAGTTASDALWTGLPVVTCCGRSVVSRLGASILSAIGLPELVTNSLEAYEALSLRLATDRQYLDSIRRKLEANRTSYPLFDTPGYCRHLEAAYTKMWELWQRGESPKSFSVERASSSRGSEASGG